MFSYQDNHQSAQVLAGDLPISQDANSIYKLLLWHFMVLIVACIVDRILLIQTALPLLSLQAVISYMMLVFNPTQRWSALILLIALFALIHLFSHPPFTSMTWTLLGQICVSIVTIIISALVTQNFLRNIDIFTLRFIHVLFSCTVGFTLLYQYMTAVATYRIDPLDLSNWQYLIDGIIGQIASIAIVINGLLMILMLKYQSMIVIPKLTTNNLMLLIISSTGILFILYFGGNLISYLSVFIVIPALWFCYRYRWWGLSSFALVINAVTMIYVMFAIIHFQTTSDLTLISQLGFSLNDMAWFLLGLNLIILYINAMIHELDTTQLSIEHSQALMVKRNDEQQLLNQQINQHNKHLINAQEFQRRKLSIELKNHMEKNIHELQQAINLLELQASLTGNGHNPFTKIKIFAHYIYMSVFELINWLKPEILERFGLIETLKSQYFADKLSLNNIAFDFSSQGDRINIPENISLVLFRITQEAINNTIKYSMADELRIRLTVLTDQIEFTIVDNGVGFDLATTEQGFGLTGMENRVKALNGSFILDSRNGTQIKMTIPLSH
jgi:glucose-6-phosphate-specific signal transduction histidine kinase